MSRYDPNEEEMLLWALYPPNKRTKIIDVDKVFGHMMRLKAGEVNPIVTDDLGIDITKLNKAQMQWVLKEGQKYKNLYEDLLRSRGHEIPQITDTGM